MLTAKQRELLIFIKQRLGETGISPTSTKSPRRCD